MDETWIREFSYTCTEEEIYLCLKRSGQRKAGPVRVGVQTGILLLLVPEKRFRHDAAREAELNRQLHVFLYDEGLAFGTPDELLPFSACRPRLYTDMAVLRFEGGAVMAVPKRVMSPEDWQLFTDRLSPVAEKMESPREKE